MENVLMCLCRAMHHYNERQIADKMGIAPTEYRELETSALAMTPAHAERLAAVYHIDAEYFLESSRQLELLLTRAEVIKYLQFEIERLRNFVFVHKELFLNSMTDNEIVVNDKNVSDGQENLYQ